jgi:diguanylate cyclase (GGDEF)-like protein
VADRLRRAIADTPFIVAGAPMRLTVSIGVAEAGAGMDGVAALMKEADAALYRAKHSGRNCVVPPPHDAGRPSGPLVLAS